MFQIPHDSLHISRRISEQRRRESRPFVRALLAADTLFARVYHKLTVITPCPIPDTGAAILVCNHISSIDPAFVQAVCRDRLISWMMAREYLEVKSLSWLFNAVGVIPVKRTGHDAGSLRAALRALGAGQVLGIFPEGKISDSPELLPFQMGPALLAIKTNTQVYPVFLEGTQRNKGMLKAAAIRNEAKIAFGEPLRFAGDASRERLEQATAEIRAAMDSLRAKIAQAVPAD